MVSLQEKSECVLWFHEETDSPITVQGNFVQVFGRLSPDVKTIKSWFSKFREIGSVCLPISLDWE